MGAMPGASVKRATPVSARQAEALRDGRLCADLYAWPLDHISGYALRAQA